MDTARYRRGFRLALIGAALLPLAGCGKRGTVAKSPPPPYEGQYKNAMGTMVLEIKDGKLVFVNPKTLAKASIPFTASADKLAVESSSGDFTLTFTAPDTLSGLPPAIAGDSRPLKKGS